MAVERTDRLNSLLREVLAEVIRDEVRHPDIHQFTTVTAVDITRDLRHAKVYISVIGTDEEKARSLAALNQSAGFIAVTASKRVVMRFFPELRFLADDSAKQAMRIEELLNEVKEEREQRESDGT